MGFRCPFKPIISILWRRRESNRPSRNLVISMVAGVSDFIDYVFDYILILGLSSVNLKSNLYCLIIVSICLKPASELNPFNLQPFIQSLSINF